MKSQVALMAFLLGIIPSYLFFSFQEMGKKTPPPHLPMPAPPILGFSLEGFPLNEKNLERLKKDPALPFGMIQFYLQWSSPLSPLKPTLEAIKKEGALACITWEPILIKGGVETTISCEEILQGKWDDYLSQVAKILKEFQETLIIRLAHEMNLERYHWGVSSDLYCSDAPKRYIQLFQYIVRFFREKQGVSVLWAFCPNAESVPHESWNEVSQYYPGDEFVDILGMDGYNFEITPSMAKARGLKWTRPWLSFEALFSPLYTDLKKIAPDKPIMVFETSSVGDKKEQEQWILEAIATAKKWGLLAILWFQVDKEENWSLQGRGVHDFSSLRLTLNPLYHFFKSDKKDSSKSLLHSTPWTDESSP